MEQDPITASALTSTTTTTANESGSVTRATKSNMQLKKSAATAGGNADGETAVAEPTPSDVVFGRGQPFHSHPGNRRMKQLISDNKERYKQAKKEDKKEIIDYILDAIRSESGRFLKKSSSEDDGGWCEATEKEAYKKVSHSLREKEVFTKKPRGSRKRSKKSVTAIAAPVVARKKRKTTIAQPKPAESSESSSSSSEDEGNLKFDDDLMTEPNAIESSGTVLPLFEFPESFALDSGSAATDDVGFLPPVATRRNSNNSSAALLARFHSEEFATTTTTTTITTRRRNSGNSNSINTNQYFAHLEDHHGLNNGAPAAATTLDPMSVDSEPIWSSSDAMMLGPLLKNCFEPPPSPMDDNDDDRKYGGGNNNNNNHHLFHFRHDTESASASLLHEQLLFTTAASNYSFSFPILGLETSTYHHHHHQYQRRTSYVSSSEHEDGDVDTTDSEESGSIDAEIVALYAENNNNDDDDVDNGSFDDIFDDDDEQ